ncbi:Ubiquinol-cytochrome C reductase hinge protein [Metschnikowia aff. pulcherrima]|uniref:Cytochrome b-c1 complex subunit 6, mitochondrial n=1 Tax=Metschnikowia aff. pulcherrima TaxID=2163413 RepID=A0A4P6XFG5_9ASCO|nr:Ubiquinol-cytochrome C reductase hinge protein [Metschnikowia aff. pulcherrima]
MREECEKSESCHGYVHHFQECVERVQKEQEEEDYAHKAYKEDCVEEFFHLQHCINDCVAPKLFYKLK